MQGSGYVVAVNVEPVSNLIESGAGIVGLHHLIDLSGEESPVYLFSGSCFELRTPRRGSFHEILEPFSLVSVV